MHRRAYFKNEDEFAFGMLSHTKERGQLTKVKQHLTQDELKLLDSQDARYIGMREQMDKNAIQKKAENLHFLDAPQGSSRHTVFLDDDEDEDPLPAVTSSSSSSSRAAATAGGKKQKLTDFDVAGYFDTHPSLLGKRANRLRLSQLEKASFSEAADNQAYKELFSRQERAKKLSRVREELDLRQHLRAKGKRMKVSDAGKDKPASYKWFPERKR